MKARVARPRWEKSERDEAERQVVERRIGEQAETNRSEAWGRLVGGEAVAEVEEVRMARRGASQPRPTVTRTHPRELGPNVIFIGEFRGIMRVRV